MGGARRLNLPVMVAPWMSLDGTTARRQATAKPPIEIYCQAIAPSLDGRGSCELCGTRVDCAEPLRRGPSDNVAAAVRLAMRTACKSLHRWPPLRAFH